MKTAWCGGCEIRNPTNTLFKASTASPYSTILNDLNEKILSNENNHKFKILESPYNERLLRTNKIRLLNVEHGVGTLRLHITSHKLRDDLDYDAISYVWGAKGTSTNVSCNETNLAIPTTVYEMLQYLYPHRSYWVDSICINQQDSEEKTVQISLMHLIYSRATHVVVWMGVPTIPSAKFMAEFPSALEKVRKWTSLVAQNLQPGLHHRHMLIRDGQFWQGLLQLLEHGWFGRLWTFQEAVLAKRPIMLHGHLSIKFDELLELVCDGWYRTDAYLRHCLSTTELFAVPAGTWQNLRRLRYRISVTSSGAVPLLHIPYLLYIVRERQVKEPVDRVWAITGLLSQNLRSKLHPLVDYSDNGRANFWRTHLEFARTIIITEQTLSLLKLPRTITRRPTSIPSWCPYLGGISECRMSIVGSWIGSISGHDNEILLVNTLNEENQPSFAGALDDQSVPHASRKYISSENYGDILRTRGHILDAISEVVEDANLVGRFDYMDSNDVSSRCLQNPVHAANVDHYTRSLHLACHTVYRTRDDIDTIPAEYLMALLCDTRVSRDATTAYKHAWSVFTDEEHHNFERVPTERRPQAIRFYDRLIELTGHSFFSTTGGRFGIATPGCKPGDKVCAFYGELPLHTLRWLEHEKNLGVIHGDEPAEFCGVAFIPHLMKPHEKEAARLGPDETFVIG